METLKAGRYVAVKDRMFKRNDCASGEAHSRAPTHEFEGDVEIRIDFDKLKPYLRRAILSKRRRSVLAHGAIQFVASNVSQREVPKPSWAE